MLDRMRKFRIKEIELEIKKIVYDLQKNVVVDSENIHQYLTMTDLNFETNPSHIAKQSNKLSLI